jgi:hypothetical protein
VCGIRLNENDGRERRDKRASRESSISRLHTPLS